MGIPSLDISHGVGGYPWDVTLLAAVIARAYPGLYNTPPHMDFNMYGDSAGGGPNIPGSPPPIITLTQKTAGGEYLKLALTPTIHVSCRSDLHDGKQRLVGMVLWSYDGKREWTLNGVEVKSGYIYVKRYADIQHIDSDQGMVHGKLYKSLFGEDPQGDLLATGFAFHDDKWQWFSRTFNIRSKEWQDDDPLASELEQRLILTAYKLYNESRGSVRSQTFRVTVDGSLIPLPPQ